MGENLVDYLPRAQSLLEAHGAALPRVAYVLVDDEVCAEREVACVLSVASREASPGRQPTRQEVGAIVVRQCRIAHSAGPAEATRRRVPRQLHRPAGHGPTGPRVCLAVCVYGGQSRTQAAELLGMSPDAVADALLVGLRQLATLCT